MSVLTGSGTGASRHSLGLNRTAPENEKVSLEELASAARLDGALGCVPRRTCDASNTSCRPKPTAKMIPSSLFVRRLLRQMLPQSLNSLRDRH